MTAWPQAYVRKVLNPLLRPGQIVVIDQLKVHKGTEVRDAIEARGCKLVFLPSYSPDLNPIEQAFSKLKAFVKRRAARTREMLDGAIAGALKTVTLSDVLGCFEHAGYSRHSF